MSDVGAFANEIRRVDGAHSLGAGALAEALMPWVQAQVRAVQVTHCLDLWVALGLPDAEFEGYYERNGYAETWAALLDAARVTPLCGAPTDSGPCVLRQHAGPVHYAADDVGRGEALPWPEPDRRTCNCGSVDKYGDDIGEHSPTCPYHLAALRKYGPLPPREDWADGGPARGA